MSVREWLEALETSSGGRGNTFKDIKSFDGVAEVMQADDATKIAFVREAIDQRAKVAERVRDALTCSWRVHDALSLHNQEGYPNASIVLANHLLRRDLPYTDDDLAFLCERTACVSKVTVGNTGYLTNLRKRIAALVEGTAPSQRLRNAVEQLAESLAAISNANQQRPAREFRKLMDEAPSSPVPDRDDEADAERLKFARQRLDVLEKTAAKVYDFEDLKNSRVVKQIVEADRETQVVVIREAVDRRGRIAERLRESRGGEMEVMEAFHMHHAKDYPTAAVVLADRLALRKLPYTDDDLVFLLQRTACVPIVTMWSAMYLNKLVRQLEQYLDDHAPSDALRDALELLESALAGSPDADDRKLRGRVAALRTTVAGESAALPILPGEAWSDAAIADLTQLDDSARAAWVSLLLHAQSAATGSPSDKWLKESRENLQAVGSEPFANRIARWLPLVDKPRTEPLPEGAHVFLPEHADRTILDVHQDMLKGLACYGSLVAEPAVARALTDLAVTSYKKLPGIGPRMVRVGNAAVWALGTMPGLDAVGQLALLKVKVKFRTAQKGIEKALAKASEREGVPREELEEMAVPAYGLTEVGRLTETLGDFTAELVVDDSKSTTLRWIKPDGKTQKSVPAAVKRDHAEDLKEIKAATKDIAKMLPAQAERIDNLYLAQRSWPLATWRERYLDHPLVGTIARRLIWEFERPADDDRVSAVFYDERLVDADGIPVEIPDDATVRPWHPIDREVDDIVAWRDWFTKNEVRQPFKQAHREVYLLTDAERNTGVYSNRFAAHIVRQHQFNALCLARGWRNQLRLMVDDEFPPASKELPEWGLRAEFWVEGAGDEYGVDTNETGTYLYLATDQVRFYPIDAASHSAHAGGGGYRRGWRATGTDEPIPLEQIPPLVLSEVLRDVDLFVGVASVGNDPNWNDGGPDGRYRDYWEHFSFGDLGETAQTRKAVLEKLVPRLKIADRCSFSDKFLVVRGDVRTYKIHLGSGNILMEPNDQYLCIVPKSGSASEKVFLPFEGDRTLSLILSKALLLAADTKITDPTILSQIA